MPPSPDCLPPPHSPPAPHWLKAMAHEQVTMSAGIDTMHGVGTAALEVFCRAGYKDIRQLVVFDAEDRKLKHAIDEIKSRVEKAHLPPSYWKALGTRCVTIIYRAKSADASPYVPAEYMCPLTLDWYDDPVVAPSGQSYSRDAIVEHLQCDRRDPVTRSPLTPSQLYPNHALRNAVEHCRLHHRRFSTPA